ncbi:MAG: hypothetical protein U0Q16_26535 [Bryobacteraceae bacterium]
MQSILGSSSLRPQASPGEPILIRGKDLANDGTTVAFDSTGMYPESAAGARVSIGGLPARILKASPASIEAIVPYALAGQKAANVVVTRFAQSSTSYSIDLVDTSPAIIASTGNGRKEGSILNYVSPSLYVPNSPQAPAPKGSVIVLYVTGAGAWETPPPYGSITLQTASFTAKPVEILIGGKAARIYFVGVPPYEIFGRLQVIAFVPNDAPSGTQPIVVRIGDSDNASQEVTIEVE